MTVRPLQNFRDEWKKFRMIGQDQGLNGCELSYGCAIHELVGIRAPLKIHISSQLLRCGIGVSRQAA